MLGVNRHLQIGARLGERISQAAGPLGLNGEGRSPLFRAVLRIHARPNALGRADSRAWRFWGRSARFGTVPA